MIKDLHNTDGYFKSAYKQFEEEPSPAAWEKIEATLNKKNAESNKIRFIAWRRAALVLLAILPGFILYDSGSFKTGSRQLAEHTINQNYPKSPSKSNESDYSKPDSAGKKSLGQNKFSARRMHKKERNVLINQDNNTRPYIDPSAVRNEEEVISIPDVLSWRQTPGETINSASAKQDRNARTLKGKFIPLQNLKYPVLNSNLSINGRKKGSFNPYWLLTVFSSYDLTNYRLDSDLPGNITRVRHSEVHEPSFSAGILATRQLKMRWAVQTGVVYSHTAVGISPQKMFAMTDQVGNIAFKYITSSGYAYIKKGSAPLPSIGDSLNTTEGKYKLQSISIPVMTKYTLGKNKFMFITGAGIEASFITSGKVETEIENSSHQEIVSINKLDGAKSFYWSLVADAEMRYQLNTKLSVGVRPVFKLALSSITKNNVVETFPYSLGIGLGLTRRF